MPLYSDNGDLDKGELQHVFKEGVRMALPYRIYRPKNNPTLEYYCTDQGCGLDDQGRAHEGPQSIRFNPNLFPGVKQQGDVLHFFGGI